MRHVMVMNAKGGCGKSTLATNIAAYFAGEGYKVAIADYDPQRSSLDWLDMRPEELPKIAGVPAYDEGLRNVPRDTEVVVIDAPARTHGSELNELVRRAETILVPVLPSPIDLKACANFMGDLLDLVKVQLEQAILSLVAIILSEL
jgi:chromosome partitioning protein